MSDVMSCRICEEPVAFRWTDTHGIAACRTCGAPYRLYHDEGAGADRRRIDKPPDLLIRAPWVPLLTRCWRETRRTIAPCAFNLPGSDAEVATADDLRIHADWLEAHRAEWPAEAGDDTEAPS